MTETTEQHETTGQRKTDTGPHRAPAHVHADQRDGTAREDDKQRQLDGFRVGAEGATLTTDQGVPVAHDDDSLKAGERGPTLMEDFQLREKLTHFDHERIPERVVHARGAGAYGYFELYDSLAEYTRASLFTKTGVRTPVFVRFSTVGGSRGSADTVRDVRGFAVKFYTDEGNFDLVGNNMPVFFIQDGMKFPDFVHAVKPEPHNEIPQASSAHDTLWDFVWQQPETMHMMMWLMSDRAVPRSFRMMQGFGVHTFRLVDAQGRATFVKFHWLPRLGVHSLAWDEAQQVAGADPDFNRRDLWDSIEAGHFPEWELGLQLISEDEARALDVDLLDPTKLVPEERVPLRIVGRMVLDRNPENFFAETEQAAFHLGNLVPGIDVSEDPLLQARLFSYLDTQLIRLGGPNFAQIPVNRPVADVHNNQRDGYHQMRVHQGESSYERNTVGGGRPAQADPSVGYDSAPVNVEGTKLRRRAGSFSDHYTQAALFWRSMSEVEQEHIAAAFGFELGKVGRVEIREGVLEHIARVDTGLAERVGSWIGLKPPEAEPVGPLTASRALSQRHRPGDGSLCARKIAVLAADGLSGASFEHVRRELAELGADVEIVAPHAGEVSSEDSAGPAKPLTAAHSLLTAKSVIFDAVLVADGRRSTDVLRARPDVAEFLRQAYRHGKAIGVWGSGRDVLAAARLNGEQRDAAVGHGAGTPAEEGVLVADGSAAEDAALSEFTAAFGAAVGRHRAWDRTLPAKTV
ncbi:catalase [Actinospica sp. MGRD01-02]|uniref:Catalase n=1 Tax=Actinospica acidithermotolerans TaxID=2828514 RepID=A0A941EEC4_9ACTN|nr:catalase [Actinospica acidithermotolerans]MBR7829118.1 catalase [Actinospica acidithermotolerans]